MADEGNRSDRTMLRGLRTVTGAAGFLLAVVYGLPSLLYPFGRDQGLYQYIGSGILEGRWPYADAFDQKPPLIYLVHALCTLVAGSSQMAIRVADLIAVLGIGALSTHVLRPAGGKGLPAGVGALLASGFYYTCFDYWHTAQVEIWEGLCLLAALAVARSEKGGMRKPLLAGLLTGAAFLFKFPAAVPGLLIGIFYAVGWVGPKPRSAAGALAGFIGSAVLVVAATVLPWALAGHLSPLIDILYGYNAHYVAGKIQPEVPSSTFWLDTAGIWTLCAGGLFLTTLALAWRRAAPDRRDGLVLLLLIIASWISVAAQRKYYGYHWGIVVPFVTLAAVWGMQRTRVLGGGTRGLFSAAALVLAGFLLAPNWDMNPEWNYRRHVGASLARWTGRIDRAGFLSPFVGRYRYRYDTLEILGREIHRQAVPGDTLCVLAFEPAIYSVSGLRCPSRFFASFPLGDPALGYRVKEYSDEHARALREMPPTFLVTIDPRSPFIPSSPGYRYEVRKTIDPFLLLRRIDRADSPN
jgi:hypothetical protein